SVLGIFGGASGGPDALATFNKAYDNAQAFNVNPLLADRLKMKKVNVAEYAQHDVEFARNLQAAVHRRSKDYLERLYHGPPVRPASGDEGYWSEPEVRTTRVSLKQNLMQRREATSQEREGLKDGSRIEELYSLAAGALPEFCIAFPRKADNDGSCQSKQLRYDYEKQKMAVDADLKEVRGKIAVGPSDETNQIEGKLQKAFARYDVLRKAFATKLVAFAKTAWTALSTFDTNAGMAGPSSFVQTGRDQPHGLRSKKKATEQLAHGEQLRFDDPSDRSDLKLLGSSTTSGSASPRPAGALQKEERVVELRKSDDRKQGPPPHRDLFTVAAGLLQMANVEQKVMLNYYDHTDVGLSTEMEAKGNELLQDPLQLHPFAYNNRNTATTTVGAAFVTVPTDPQTQVEPAEDMTSRTRAWKKWKQDTLQVFPQLALRVRQLARLGDGLYGLGKLLGAV
ncbi:unnamed protein product, partial [Amoebophrya sp. A120]